MHGIYQWNGDIFIWKSVFSPGIISEVQDSSISLDFAVHADGVFRQTTRYFPVSLNLVATLRQQLKEVQQSLLPEQIY